MKSNLAVWVIAGGLLLSAAGFAKAQDSTTTQQQTTTTTSTTDNNAAPSANLPDKDSAATPSQSAANTPESSATSTQETTTADRSADVRTVTGCLRRGDGADEYRMTGQDGSTWELRSDAVDLASHVGHTVTITGAVRNAAEHGMKEDAKREAQEHGMDKGATEHGHMTVTNLKMVSRSCS